MLAPTDLIVFLTFICRGGYYPPAIYKNIIVFCTGSRGRLPLRVCAIFVILVVGATIGRPSFIKVSLRFERTCNARPYGFNGYLKFCL